MSKFKYNIVSAASPIPDLGNTDSQSGIFKPRDLRLNPNYSLYPLRSGQEAFTTPGTYTWVCPNKVYSVSVVCIGAGGTGVQASGGYVVGPAGGGGGLGWKNNITVIPGNSYTVVVGGSSAGDSYFINLSTVAGFGGVDGGAGGGFVGDGGGNGGLGGGGRGGGGAGGYTGNGGAGGSNPPSNGTAPGGAGSGGGGAGGGNFRTTTGEAEGSNGGGGVGIFGQGTSGTSSSQGGSGGTNGTLFGGPSNGVIRGGNGGGFGGGSGCGVKGGGGFGNSNAAGDPGTGAVRIIWSSAITRAFPATNTTDV